MADQGYQGEYSPTIIDKGSLVDLRKIAGPAPVTGKHWVMVDLDTGVLKWYQSRKRSFGGFRRGFQRRRY